MHCKLHYLSKAFGPKISPDLETKWQNVISRWRLLRPLKTIPRTWKRYIVVWFAYWALYRLFCFRNWATLIKKFHQSEVNHWNINNHRKTYPWRSNFSESGLQYHRWLYCCARIPLRFSSDYRASQWDFCFRSSPKSQRHVDYWFSMPASETTRSKFIDPVVRSNAVGRNALLPIRSFIHYHLNHPSRVRKHSIKSDTTKFSLFGRSWPYSSFSFSEVFDGR